MNPRTASAPSASTKPRRTGSRTSRADARTVTPPRKRSFRVPEVMLGLMLVAGCALAAVVWQRSANSTTTIVVARRVIARGSLITAEDLRGAEVGGETGAMIAGSDAQLLVGQAAVVDIDAGVPLTRALVIDTPPLGIGEALTSVALAPGDLPPDLAAGDHIKLVITVDGASGERATSSLVDDEAIVWAVDEAADGISTVVTLRGPIGLATQIAAASDVRLVRIVGG
ncbi:MAG: putative rane protein [Acidimicrobiales bacterium]|nr:putative rane protein [Acidimicrobiales bacterium]